VEAIFSDSQEFEYWRDLALIDLPLFYQFPWTFRWLPTLQTLLHALLDCGGSKVVLYPKAPTPQNPKTHEVRCIMTVVNN